MATPTPRKGTLYLVTYDRGTYPLTGEVKPYHWSYFLELDKTEPEVSGVYSQLRGMPGGFYYPGLEFQTNSQMQEAGYVKDKLEIGEVNETTTLKLSDTLAAVEIIKDESSKWNCQDWALAGFVGLKEAGGIVYDHLTPEIVKEWLRER